MPTPRHYATNADRQAAYRARLAAPSPRGSPPSAAPGARRRRTLIGQARALLETVAGEMASYEAARSEAWHDSERGERFTERQETLVEALALLRDLAEASRYASAPRRSGRASGAGLAVWLRRQQCLGRREEVAEARRLHNQALEVVDTISTTYGTPPSPPHRLTAGSPTTASRGKRHFARGRPNRRAYQPFAPAMNLMPVGVL